jgi:glycosyltransferase involved in cell wall biosynthesis
MKKLTIALHFYIGRKSPHNNKGTICAPMTLLEDIASRLHKKGHKVFFINSKDSKNKPYYYKTPLFNHTVDHPEIKKLNDANKQKEKAKLVAEFNNMVVEEFLEKHGSKIDIFHSHKIEYSLGGMHSQQESFASVFTHHDPVSKAHNVWTKKAKNKLSNPHFTYLSKNHSKTATTKNKHILYNGINPKLYPFSKTADDFLAFSGRMVKEKNPLVALKIAKELNKPIKLAGIATKGDKYWEKQIKPLLSKERTYLGLLPYDKMYTLYQKARALLFPIQWEEPFGLVMVEAMACGTPVIAFKRGSVPEIIKHGKTGFIVNNQQEMIKATKKLYSMPEKEYTAMRNNCRKHVEKNFSVEKMVKDYEKLYYKIVKI